MWSNNSVLGFMGGVAVCLTACISMGSNDSGKIMEQRPVVASTTMSPEIPAAVPFCGKLVDITRYDMRESYDRELSSFTYFHSTTMLLIKRANRYFPVIEPIPPARAVGMWQLLEGTAKEFGLTITPTVDERCDVAKSTEAACRYLNSAYKKYGDWAAVAAAYNGGMGRISGELTKQDAESSFDLWLVEETTRYVYRIMAIKQIFENPAKYGFVMRARDLYKPIACDEVKVSADILSLADFAKEHGVTYADLKRFNPWLRDRKLATQGRTYTILVPKRTDMFYDKPNTWVHNPAWVVAE